MLSLFRGLDPSLRRRLMGMALIMLVISVLEVVTTGAMFPVVAALVERPGIGEGTLLHRLRTLLPPASDEQFVLVLAVGLLVIVVVKTVVVGFGYRFQYLLAYDVQRELAKRLLRAYTEERYSRHLRRNPADLLKNVQNEIPALANGILIPTLQAASELLIALAILGLLLFLDPVLTLTLGISLGLGMWFIYGITKRSNDRFGANRSQAVGEMFRSASTLLAGLKELKVLGREETYRVRYEAAARVYGRSNAHIMLMAQVPRLAFELLTFAGFVGILAYIWATSGNMRAALPLLATYAVGAYRLMPAFGKIMGASMQRRFYRRTLEIVRQALDEVRVETPMSARGPGEPLSFRSELALKNLSYTYPGSDQDALREVSLSIPCGSAVGIVGPSGAGKSTLIDVLLGLLDEYRGQILVDGRRLDVAGLREWRALIGYVPQAIYLADETLRRNVAFGLPDESVDEAAVRRACEAAQLAEVIADLPQGYDTVLGERGVRLSGGQRQRVGIARALYHDPEILILDEATSALDGLTEVEIAREIDFLAGHKTLIIIAHRLSTIKKCARIYVMERGQISASGTYDELAADSDYFSRVLRAA